MLGVFACCRRSGPERRTSAWRCCAPAAGAPCAGSARCTSRSSRNAPDYIMVVWVHFVLPLLIGTLIGRRLEFNPFVSAVIALGFVYSGYFAETFRAGIEAVPRGADRGRRGPSACPSAAIMWRMILPQVVRRMLPESINQFISLFKATSIVSLIAVPDLMYQVSMITAAGDAAAAAVHRRRADLLRDRVRCGQPAAACCRAAGATASWPESGAVGAWATGNDSSGTSATRCCAGLPGHASRSASIAFACAIVGGLAAVPGAHVRAAAAAGRHRC